MKHIPVRFDGEAVGWDRVHLLVADGKVLVAPVAVESIGPSDLKAVRKQLHALGLELGLVVNFHDTAPRTRVVRA